MSFPSIFSSFNRPNPTDRLNSPSHSALHNTVSSAVGQLEAVIGQDGNNSVLGTLIGDLRSPNSPGGGHIQTANTGGTGQTVYAKGNLLVGQSQSVLGKLAVSTDGLALIADSTQALGVKWGVPNNKPTVLIYGFSSSVITWNKPSVMAYAIIECVGGGGGGGGATGGAGISSAGGGGGGGSYARKYVVASSLGVTEQITIGTAGTAGTAGNNTGGTGGTTVFGASSILVTPGGSGGNGSNGNAGTGLGGLGASVLSGDIYLSGQDGISGTGNGSGLAAGVVNGGIGGYSFLTTQGRGGLGATVISPAGSAAGNAGQSGFVAITMY